MPTTTSPAYARHRPSQLSAVRDTALLIVGAGPFGLAMAAYAQHLGIEHTIVGEPMGAWKSNMPRAMILRSHLDWHLDPLETHTLERYLAVRGLDRDSVEPLSRDFYLGYADWFQQEKGIHPVRERVVRLDAKGDGFVATLSDGEAISADKVVLAIGFANFAHIPADLAALLPPEHYSHTCHLVEFEPLRDKRCLIIGGRQSAFEWAALLAEHGAAAVHVCHRHPTPLFQDSEWGWINSAVERFVDEPGWYRNLTGQEKQQVHDMFAEAKIKLEPWLWLRIDKDNVRLWPDTRLAGCAETTQGVKVSLTNGRDLTVDHVVLATGYRVDMQQVPFIATGNLSTRLQLDGGYPTLDSQLQTNIPGLFITSLPACQDFGPFFAFTVAVKASAKVIGKALG